MAKSDDKSLPDQALEALLYAPIGIAYEVIDRLPSWVARGKSQATITKMLGKMAVQKGQSEFEGVVSDIFGVKLGEEAPEAPSAAETPKTPSSGPKTATVSKSKPKASTTAPRAAGDEKPKKPKKKPAKAATKTESKSGSKTTPKTKKKAQTKSPKSSTKASKPAKPTKSATAEPKVPVENDLALASYGSMPASQIVKRLDSLSPEQLEAIRVFEETNRHRVTVLNRIRQIQRAA